jgi:hypothetical protein
LDRTARTCIVYPLSADGLALPPNVDFTAIVQAFHREVAFRLETAGIVVLSPDPNVPDSGVVVVRSRLAMATAGSRWKRYFVPVAAGAAAKVEVEGSISYGEAPLTQFRSLGKRTFGTLGGVSRDLLASAAQEAGRQVAVEALSVLAGR